jgi:hypothetical protein
MTEPDIEQAIQRVKAGCVDDYATVVSAYHNSPRELAFASVVQSQSDRPVHGVPEQSKAASDGLAHVRSRQQ